MAITVRSIDPDWAEAQAIAAYHTLRQATPEKVVRPPRLPSSAEPRARRLFWIALAVALLVAVAVAVTTSRGN